MSNGLMISAWALSAQGSEINQDNVYLNGHYFTPDNNEEVISYSKASNVEFQMYGVCDGDAQGAPESAPAYAVMQRMQHLQSVLSMDGTVTRDKIWSFLCDTNARIRDMQTAAGSADISSTFACLFLQKNRGLAVHLGDSRIYVIRGGRMLQITEDHLEANDLYKLGVITQQQAEVHKLKSKPTAKLGMQDIYEVEASVFSKYFVFYPGDIFLICTDGITDSISNAAIERTIAGIQDPAEIAETLLRMTYNKNQDNKSIVVLYVDEVDGEQAPVREVAVEETPEETYEETQEEAYDETPEEENTAEEEPYEYDEEGEPAYEETEESYADSASAEETEEYDEEEDEEDEEEEKPARKSLDLRSKLASLAAKVGAGKKDSKSEEEVESEEEESEEDEKEESPKKKLGAFFSRFTQKASDEEEEEETEDDSEEQEMPETEENVNEKSSDDADAMDAEPDEEEEDEDEDEKKSPILGALAFLKGKFAKNKDSESESEEEKPESDTEEDEESEDEELSILDKIFADPKRILAILAGIVILIILIVLLSTKGCKSGSGDTSSVEESSLVEESSEEESSAMEESSEEVSGVVEESSEEVSGIVEESSAEESSEPEISGFIKSEGEGKKDRPADLPEESSEEESYEESYEESSYYEESSVYYPPEESSVYYPPVESSYEDPVKYITIEEGGYVTYWDIIMDFYGEWSDELYAAFCEYNGIEVDSSLSYGQVLAIPPMSYLGL